MSVHSDGWDPAEIERGSSLPVWPWERDRMADALRACHCQVVESKADRAEAARLYELTRELVRRTYEGNHGAGGARRVFVRACARWLGVTSSAFILSAIDDAIVSTVAKCPDQVLPVTRREQRALVVAAIDKAFGEKVREDLAALVDGGAA